MSSIVDESDHSITLESGIFIDSSPVLESDEVKAAEDLIELLNTGSYDGAFVMPYGPYNARFLTPNEAVHTLGTYAYLPGYQYHRREVQTGNRPIVYAPGRYNKANGLFIQLSENPINPVNPYDGMRRYYRYETPKALESIMHLGYYQVPLRGCLFDEVPYKSGWASGRVCVGIDLECGEVNKGDFAYSLAFHNQCNDNKLPEELKKSLEELSYIDGFGTGLSRTERNKQMSAQILRGGELLGTLQHINVDRISVIDYIDEQSDGEPKKAVTTINT